MRDLGVNAAGQLQAKKASEVEIIASSEIDVDLMGSFMNGFDLSNYEYFERGSVEDEKKDEEEEVDERTKRKQKTIDDVVVLHEKDVSTNERYIG